MFEIISNTCWKLMNEQLLHGGSDFFPAIYTAWLPPEVGGGVSRNDTGIVRQINTIKSSFYLVQDAYYDNSTKNMYFKEETYLDAWQILSDMFCELFVKVLWL